MCILPFPQDPVYNHALHASLLLPTLFTRLCTTCTISTSLPCYKLAKRTSRECSGRPPPAASPWQAERVPGFTAGGDVPEALPSDQAGGCHLPVHEAVCRWSSVADTEGSLCASHCRPKSSGGLETPKEMLDSKGHVHPPLPTRSCLQSCTTCKPSTTHTIY